MLGMGMGVGVGVGAVSAPGEPAITLDFVNSNELDPRVTFSRGTNATYVDSAGNIAYAPSNLLTYSEQFDNAIWVKSGTTIAANATTAPDGLSTADSLIEDTALLTTHTIARPGSASVDKITPVTFSIYVKAVNRTRLRLRVNYYSGNTVAGIFNLADSSTSAVSSGLGVATGSNISNLDNGWFRCSVSGYSTSAGAGFDTDLFILSDAGS